MAAAMTDQLEIKLKPDVKIARRGDEVVLVGEASRALRLAGTSCQLIDLLAAGCSRKALGMHLQTLGFPAGQIEPAIAAFLSRLASAGVLQSKHDSANAAQGRRMINVDPLARFFARPILLLPGWLAVSVGCWRRWQVLPLPRSRDDCFRSRRIFPACRQWAFSVSFLGSCSMNSHMRWLADPSAARYPDSDYGFGNGAAFRFSLTRGM